MTAVDSVSPSDPSEDAGSWPEQPPLMTMGPMMIGPPHPVPEPPPPGPVPKFLPLPPGPVPKFFPPPPGPVPKFFPLPPAEPSPFAKTSPLITIGPITTGQQQPDPVSSPPGPVPKFFPLPPGPVGKFFPLPPGPVPKFLPLPPDTCSVLGFPADGPPTVIRTVPLRTWISNSIAIDSLLVYLSISLRAATLLIAESEDPGASPPNRAIGQPPTGRSRENRVESPGCYRACPASHTRPPLCRAD